MWARIIALLAAAGVASCEQPVETTAAPAVAVYFVEHEPGFEPARTRMIITRDFLRIDGGRKGRDFVLYDRARRTIYNVSAADSLILVMGPRPVNAAPPMRLKHNIERDRTAAPDVGGIPVAHYRLRTNGKLCYDLYAADGLLPEAVKALREYREILAGEQALAMEVTPRAMQTPCDLANNVFAPARYLAHGFPIRVAETDGRAADRERITELVDYETDFEAAADMFRLPESYRRLTLQELRGR